MSPGLHQPGVGFIDPVINDDQVGCGFDYPNLEVDQALPRAVARDACVDDLDRWPTVIPHQRAFELRGERLGIVLDGLRVRRRPAQRDDSKQAAWLGHVEFVAATAS